jgi:hypothetical protein
LPTGSLQTQNFGAPWMRITTGPAALTAPPTPVRNQAPKAGSLDVQVYGLGSTSRSLRRHRGLEP